MKYKKHDSFLNEFPVKKTSEKNRIICVKVTLATWSLVKTFI